MCMQKANDNCKAVRQHLEMDDFFTDGLVVRGGQSLETGQDSAEQESSCEQAKSSERTEALKQIALQISCCRKCKLGAMRTNPVPGQGNPNARIVFVGEAPGAQEDAQGVAFIGRAGQLLTNIIEACGLNRRDVFICNILKCRPPDNRDPAADEIVSCLPYLQKQLELINPEVIVALGAHAARTLLDTNKPIGQLRGRFHDYIAVIGMPAIKLMATYHPSYLLRNYSQDSRRRVWEDMKQVLIELGLPIPERSKK